LTHTPQVLFTSCGADLASLTPCLADAYTDSIPLLLFSSQGVSSDDRSQARHEHREVLASKLFNPLLKHKNTLHGTEEMETMLSEALIQAVAGRPGPVLIEFHDLLLQTPHVDENTSAQRPRKHSTFTPTPDAAQLFLLSELLRDATQPLLLAGQGVLLSQACRNLIRLVDTHQLPLVTTLLGTGAIPSDHPLHLGMIGRTGMPAANRALHECDLLIVLGARLSPRQTGAAPQELCPKAHVVRIDIDLEELAQANVHSELDLHSDIDHALQAILTSLRTEPLPVREEWLSKVKEYGRNHPVDSFPVSEGFHPADLLRRINHLTCGEDLLVVTGGSEAQTWAARHLTFTNPSRQLLTSGGQGSTGYDLPTAIGAALQQPETTVLCVTGDQLFQTHLQELSTLVRYGLSVKILLLDRRSDEKKEDLPNPSELCFQQLAKAYGVPALQLSPLDEDLDATLQKALSCQGPVLLHARVDPHCAPTPQLDRVEALDVMWRRSE
jgi:acetolactate synthase-1/2/3 large subunit